MTDNFSPEVHSQPAPVVVPLSASLDSSQQASDSSGNTAQHLRMQALREVTAWDILPKRERCLTLEKKWRGAADAIETAFAELRTGVSRAHPLHEQVIWF